MTKYNQDRFSVEDGDSFNSRLSKPAFYSRADDDMESDADSQDDLSDSDDNGE